ncbi:glycosyltransferase family 90 protein [Patellaria atrata CBS 101060]|uniref:Glycosyltransferase family 90 protein n=1 Tax=Patellaria atrata CBS 101060 TaxID=1346257 RepID=A0A9P4VNL3_9PEZI|nr:glycosyltransferase family 90 protein [Patellaria atrata CBS 101060]
MERSKLLSLSGLILGIWYVSTTYETSATFEYPLHSFGVILLFCGLAILLTDKLIPVAKSELSRESYLSITQEDLDGSVDRAHLPTDGIQGNTGASEQQLPLRRLRGRMILVLLAVLLAVLGIRLELLRRIIENVQCSDFSPEPFLPLYVAVHNYWRIQKYASNDAGNKEDSSKATHDGVYTPLHHRRFSSVLITFLLGCSCVVSSAHASAPTSTYICAHSLPYSHMIPLFQLLGFLFDCVMLSILIRFLEHTSETGSRGFEKFFTLIGWFLLLASLIHIIIGVTVSMLASVDHMWISTFPTPYLFHLIKISLGISVTVVCALRSLQHVSLMTTSVIIIFVVAYCRDVVIAWRNSLPYPPAPDTAALLAILFMVLIFGMYFLADTVADPRHYPFSRPTFRAIPRWFILSLILLCLSRAGLWLLRHDEVRSHPIDILIHEGLEQHQTWSKQATASQSLGEAVMAYEKRYGRSPPPNFDHWYDFAKARSSIVIDDFDNIENDLLPFWALTPAVVRQRTWNVIANPAHFVGGILIRDGKAQISTNVVPTHRWMLEGVIRMIDQFSTWLPDMDLGFNLNDECRVAVPFEVIEPLKAEAQRQKTAIRDIKAKTFSPNRADVWSTLPTQAPHEKFFEDASGRKSFASWGSIGCAPKSRARTESWWNKKHICTECTKPHSLGQFVSNWTLAADICHQPDIADLHGFYISPASFKTTRHLLPVFSQSRVSTYNDIRYPSAWNYMDKVAYAPSDEYPDVPYENKTNTLFWRGVTSEGVSSGRGAWRGMARQRFVHEATNLTSPRTMLFSYTTSINRTFIYRQVEPSDVGNILSTDVRLTEIARCGQQDCFDQKREFGLGNKTDFQEHWNYRYLYDGDGAGFSGRFLPFLQSGSLPFKTALFREWYEGRLTAWVHFVPLDLRLHGLWSTLAYFSGVGDRLGNSQVSTEGKEKEGQLIANAGREWAAKVLRKEDMEIYFFRLLLEWGRLTDDRRDEIGYKL